MLNHWKPEGDFFVGDCMPFFDNGVFHLYYLLDQGHHNHPIVGCLGGHQWAHASTTDLKHWTHHPLALPLDFEAGEASNCTGSMFRHGGKIYAFYALRSRHFSGERFRFAVSEDGGVHFTRVANPALDASPEGYTGAFRDPVVWSGADGRFHLLMTSESATAPARAAGCLLHFTAADLVHWELDGPILRAWSAPECSDCFTWKGRRYLTCGIDGMTRYRIGDVNGEAGPWRVPDNDLVACTQVIVAKSAPWRDDRRLLVGWLSTFVRGEWRFAGRTIFRELLVHADGTLGTRWVPEMMPDFPEPDRLPDRVLDGGAGADAVEFPRPEAGEWLFEGSCRRRSARFLRIDFTFAAGAGRTVLFDLRNGAIEIDNGHSRCPGSGTMPEEFRFRIWGDGDVIDVEVDGERTAVSTGESGRCVRVSVAVPDGAVELTGLSWRAR